MKRERDLELSSSAIRRDQIGTEVRTFDLIGIQVTVGTHTANAAAAVSARDCNVQLEGLIVERAGSSWSRKRGAVRCKQN